ncbi:MAG TPA: hypothetical protein PK513_05360 [Alphaproteobacteria bacterium]|nr:hypothetical protein [Alphaproteobacteria bacterium]USO06312.1 MAG: hypothetical protein H6859_03745 [Rhodospirillales bacterium]HOO81909.1 hypothetical protein [Alphaproteobacteria bacterium]
MNTPPLVKVFALYSTLTFLDGCSTPRQPNGGPLIFGPIPVQPTIQSWIHGNDEPKDDCERDVVVQAQGWLDKYGQEMDENITFYSPLDEIKSVWDAKKFLSDLEIYLAPVNATMASRKPSDYADVRELNRRIHYNNRFEPARVIQKALGAKGPSFEHFNCRW